MTDYLRKRGKRPFSNRYSAEYFGKLRCALPFFGHKAKFLEFVEIMGEIGRRGTDSSRTSHVQLGETVNQQGDMRRLANNGQKLKKGLLELVECVIMLQKRVLVGHSQCGLVLIGKIVGLEMKMWIDLETENMQLTHLSVAMTGKWIQDRN